MLKQPTFSPLGNVPAELVIAGGAVPDLKVTCRLVVNGVSRYGFQTGGRHGLMLYAGSPPVVTDGLFSGVDSWSCRTYGAMTGNTGQLPQPTGPYLWDNTMIRGSPNTFDVTFEVHNGLAKTTVATMLPTGVPDSIQIYTTTAADANNWNGQMKFAAFGAGLGANYAYSRAFVSNISFYKKSP